MYSTKSSNFYRVPFQSTMRKMQMDRRIAKQRARGINSYHLVSSSSSSEGTLLISLFLSLSMFFIIKKTNSKFKLNLIIE